MSQVTNNVVAVSSWRRPGSSSNGERRDSGLRRDVFLRINGWRLQRPPLQIHAEVMHLFETGTFDIAHLDPWLRAFALSME